MKPLDPPYNPMGMAILNSATKGMSQYIPPEKTNKRAERMQSAITDVQKAMNPDDSLT
jgi:hypothetical protein